MRRLSLFFFFATLSLTAFSQNLERYNWYFGGSTQAIRFNRTSRVATVVSKAIPFSGGGSATASDPGNANLLFYTDGQLVYDASHLRMPQGLGLTGNTAANQPVVICPVPGQTNKYFIFTNTANFTTGGTITVSVVDMGLFGNALFPAPALGDLESKNGPTGLANRAEGMVIIPHANGTDFWLVTQQVNSTNFTSTLINAASYTGTFTSTTVAGTSIPTTAANLSYHAGKKKIAVSAQDTNTDAIILDFNSNTGAITFDRFIFNSGLPTTTNQSIYDIEWSVKGDYLYLSRYGEPGVQADLLQYDYQNPTTTLTSVLPAAVFRSYGVQMAPDSSIYHLYQAVSGGPILLGKFSKTDTIASQVNYKSNQLTATSLAGTQFPSFAPRAKVTLTVNFTFTGNCQNNNTAFFPDVQPGADSLHWNFGDGTDTTAWGPIHKYGRPSTYNVALTAYYQGDSGKVTLPVTINPFTLILNLVQDTTACRSEFPPKRGSSSPKQFSVKASVTGGTPTSYTWSNGDTGPILTPDSAGYYYVVVKDASGCSTYAGTNVKEYKLQDQRSNVWYFGTHAGIDFNRNPPVALSNSAMDAPEGCAIVCDRNGKAIFYTDGDKVYNKKDSLIATGIGGDPLASQSSIIVPVPGDETLYYIFTNEAINGTSSNMVKWSLFDLKQNKGLGAVVKQSLPLFAKSTERITANGKWLIIHEYGNNTFRTYPITNLGIGDPVLTAIGSDHSFANQAQGEGYMKLGPKNMLAVALSIPGTGNFVELFHLNDSTGKITSYRKIDLKQPTGNVYGIEFSPGGNKVFATVKGTPSPSQVYEYSIDSIGHPHFKQRIQQAAELGEIQLAPNGQIFMAINGSNVLGTIQATDDTTKLSVVNFSGFTLAAGTKSTLGLPNFRQQVNNAFGGPSADITGFCLGSPTNFKGTPTDAIDKMIWFFGDGGSDTNGDTQHTYAAAGKYNVTFNVSNRCGLDTTLVKPITIFPPPGKPTIPGAGALCNGPLTLNANTANLPGLSYLWTTGQTTQTITVSVQSIVGVKITDINGCTSSGQSLVADNQPQVDIGPDQTLCQNSFTLALNAQNPGATYAWTVNGGSPTSAQSRPLDTSLPGVYTYKVVVTDPVTTCTATSQAIFTVKASPSFTLSGTNPTSCNGSDGTLTLTLSTTTPVTGPYSYFLTGPNSFNQQAIDQTAPNTFTFNGLKAGVFSGVVNDQVSGCTISQSFGLSSAPPGSATAVPITFCDPETIQVTTTLTFPIQYQATNNATGTATALATAAGPSPFNMSTPLSAGTYTIQLTDNVGCITSINNFAVTPNAPVNMTVTPGICSTPPTITASGGATNYSWTGTGTIVGPTNGPTITVSGQGQFTYTVTGSGPGVCPNTQTTTVVLDSPTADFTQTDPCQPSIVLTASPSGSYTYRWYKGGAFQPALLGQSITLGLSENLASYQTELFNTLNGCAYKSSPKTVAVTGIVDAALSATPACEDGNPFTLTATTSATGATFAWFKNSTLIPGETNATTSQTDVGTYKVDISKGTCKASSQLSVTRAPLPVGKLQNRAIICNDPENKDPKTNQIDLDPGQFVKYNWFKNELTINYTQRVYTATSQGKYKVDLTNSFGCVAPDEVEVLNECLPRIDAPNAFKPGSTVTNPLDPSYKNSEFWVLTSFIQDTSFSIFIYNRWGDLVYTSSDRNFRWKGDLQDNGQLLPSGAYAYVIKYVSSFHPERGVQETRGGVVLLR